MYKGIENFLDKISSYQFPIFVLIGIIAVIIYILFEWLVSLLEICIFTIGFFIKKIFKKRSRHSLTNRNSYERVSNTKSKKEESS
jgi:c-di-AMP phosphodiesterase-like protein